MSDEPESPDLSTVPTGDLVVELCQRFDAAVFVGERVTQGDRGFYKVVPSGSATYCLGLIERARRDVMAMCHDVGDDGSVNDDEIGN